MKTLEHITEVNAMNMILFKFLKFDKIFYIEDYLKK